MNPKTIKRLEQLKNAMDEGTVQQDDFLKIIESLLNIIKDVKNQIENNVVEVGKRLLDNVNDVRDSVDLMNKTHKKSIENVKELSDKNLDKVFGEINKTKSLIPTVPNLSWIQNKFDEIKIPTVDEIEKDLPKLGFSIRDGLELLKNDDRLDKSAIKGLEEELKKINDNLSTKGGRMAGGGRTGGMQMYDLSSQTNGVLKVFTVPKNKNGMIIGSDFPTVLMENNGFTVAKGNRTQITLTPDNAPSTGSQLVFLYTSVFNI